MDEITIPVSPGELLDKMTILQIKEDRIDDPAKLENIRRERQALAPAVDRVLAAHEDIEGFRDELRGINERLWGIEDDIRDCELRGEFGEEFIALARAVYQTNDLRAEVKRRINSTLGSELVEEKSYRGDGSA